MNKIVHYQHDTKGTALRATGGFYLILIVSLAINYVTLAEAAILGICIPVFTGAMFLWNQSSGLHICGEEIYIKTIRKKRIDVQGIAVIRITKSMHHSTQSKITTPIHDDEGNQLYSMMALCKYDPQRIHVADVGDYSFGIIFREETLFCVVYDQEAVDYLQRLNPNIVVVPPDGGQPQRKPGPMRAWVGRTKFNYP